MRSCVIPHEQEHRSCAFIGMNELAKEDNHMKIVQSCAVCGFEVKRVCPDLVCVIWPLDSD